MDYLLVYPMAAMVLLTAVVFVRMFLSRFGAVRAGEVSATYYKTYQGAEEPRASAQLSRHFINLFESPTLFYVACVVAMLIGQTGTLMLVLAWAYVAARAAHAWIHTGKNKMRPRMIVYLVSWIVLMAMWTNLVIGVTAMR